MKSMLGIVAIVIGIISYIPYVRGMYANTVKPHAFSWFVWSIITAIGFAVQVAAGGGPASWPLGVTTFVCFGVAIGAHHKGDRTYTVFDWLALLGAMLAIVLWAYTSEPIVAAVLIVIADVFGFFPTIIKAWSKPYEEGISVYALSAFKFVIIILAIEAYSLTTLLEPMYLVLANIFFCTLLIVRRGKVSPVKAS